MSFALTIIFAFLEAAHAQSATSDQVITGEIGGLQASNGVAIVSEVTLQTGSSVTLYGASGYISSGSSVNAQGFFGYEGELKNVAVMRATQTFNAPFVFESSFTVQSNGRRISFSTSAAMENIFISQDGDVGFYPNLHNSSSTSMPEYSTTTHTAGPCVPGSTITIRTTGGRVEVNFYGTLMSTVTPNGLVKAHASFLQDGNFPLEFSSTKGILGDYAGSRQSTVGFTFLLESPAPGTHTYCLSIYNPFDGQSIILKNDSETSNLFYVKEIL